MRQDGVFLAWLNENYPSFPPITAVYQPLPGPSYPIFFTKENMTPLKNIYKNNLIAEEKLNEMETSDRIILKSSNLGHVLVQALI